MAGTITLSMTQQIDKDTQKPLAGGKLTFFAAGTTAYQNAYSDLALTIILPNPITLDAAGRLPQFFLADGQIKVILTNKNGVTQLVADNLLVIGPSSGGGGGGGGSVDPTTVLTTGDIKTRYGIGILTGFVRMNGRTIGSASSGATERPNADTQFLFLYLWTDPNLVVSGGRGASAAADWTANKTIALPDARGRVLASLDDMGNVPAGRISSTYFGGAPSDVITIGKGGGLQLGVLQTANLPPYTPIGGVAGTFSGTGTGTVGARTPNNFTTGGGGVPVAVDSANATTTNNNVNVNVSGNIAAAFTGTAQGGISTPFSVLPPMLLITNYIKL